MTSEEMSPEARRAIEAVSTSFGNLEKHRAAKVQKQKASALRALKREEQSPAERIAQAQARRKKP